MTTQSCLVIVLAAGEGTRMKSAVPKVLHEVGNRPMVAHVLELAREIGGDRRAAVIGPDATALGAAIGAADPEVTVYLQNDRLGTAHAVLAAREALSAPAGHVLVLYGDTPLMTAATLTRLRAALDDGADIAVLGFEAEDPTGYGRLIVDGERLLAIREHKDASDAERAIKFCNSGVLGFRGTLLPDLLDRIGNDNAKNEYYLTDAVALVAGEGGRVVAIAGDEEEFLGVNTRADLARAEAVFQARRRAAAMAGGATLAAPDTVFFSHDTVLGRDVVIGQNVVFGPGVTVDDGAVIKPFSHLEGCRVRARAAIGPYARLRTGADIGDGARIGNFVELKNASVETGAKVNHLAYVGDARVGANANVGAGTITCNYDGFLKHHTDIGAGAFIGSNSALVAPVRIGDNAIVAAGSVIVTDVPGEALAVARCRQNTIDGRADDIRRLKQAEKTARASTEKK